jgi:hypothetical protein
MLMISAGLSTAFPCQRSFHGTDVGWSGVNYPIFPRAKLEEELGL